MTNVVRTNLFFLMTAVIGLFGGSLRAQLLTDAPENTKAIKVDEKLGLEVPRDLVFVNERGEPTSFGKICDGKRPVILTLNYSDCPGLCVAQLNGLAEGLSEMFGVALGSDFQMVSVSIDPRETPEKAAKFKARYATMLSPEHNPKAWHFLTADAKTIESITRAVGFGYNYDPNGNRFNHASVAVLLSPTGKITRYLYSVRFDPETLRLSLIEAGEGKIGTTTDQILLWCFHYNPSENRYSADAKRILSFAAGAFVLIGLGVSIPFWFSRPPASPHVTPTASGKEPSGTGFSENSSVSNLLSTSVNVSSATKPLITVENTTTSITTLSTGAQV